MFNTRRRFDYNILYTVHPGVLQHVREVWCYAQEEAHEVPSDRQRRATARYTSARHTLQAWRLCRHLWIHVSRESLPYDSGAIDSTIGQVCDLNLFYGRGSLELVRPSFVIILVSTSSYILTVSIRDVSCVRYASYMKSPFPGVITK